MCKLGEDLTEEERTAADEFVKWTLEGGPMPKAAVQMMDGLVQRISQKRLLENDDDL